MWLRHWPRAIATDLPIHQCCRVRSRVVSQDMVNCQARSVQPLVFLSGVGEVEGTPPILPQMGGLWYHHHLKGKALDDKFSWGQMSWEKKQGFVQLALVQSSVQSKFWNFWWTLQQIRTLVSKGEVTLGKPWEASWVRSSGCLNCA